MTSQFDPSKTGKQFMSYDPFTGITTYFEGNGDGSFKLHYESDVEAVLDRNESLYNTGWDGYVSKSRELRHAAEIPNAVILKWLIEEGIDVYNKEHWPAVKRKLNDIEWRKLRVANWRV